MAVKIVINNFPPNISTDNFSVDLTIIGAKQATNYLRIELYKDGSTNYFGETFNNKDWYSGADGLSYFPVEIKSASSSATIQGRLGNSKEYSGPGGYKLKIKRYTQSGNQAFDDENPVDIQITYKLETPTPVPTPIPIQTPIPTITSPSPKSTLLFSPTPIISPEVLAISSTIETEKPIMENKSSSNFPFIPASVFAIGLFFVGISVYLFYTKSNAQKNN